MKPLIQILMYLAYGYTDEMITCFAIHSLVE